MAKSNLQEENRRKYEPIARQLAEKFGINPDLFAAQIQQESGWNPQAKSGVGAQGIAQIMPATQKSWGVKNVHDPIESLTAAAKNMAAYVKTYQNNKKFNPSGDYLTAHKLALAAYNAGPGNVNKHGGIPPFSETQNYVKVISKAYKGEKQGLEKYSKENIPSFPKELYKAEAITPQTKQTQEVAEQPQSKYVGLGSPNYIASSQPNYMGLASPKIYQAQQNRAELDMKQLELNRQKQQKADQISSKNMNLDQSYLDQQSNLAAKKAATSIPIYQPQSYSPIVPKLNTEFSQDLSGLSKRLASVRQGQNANADSTYGQNFNSYEKYLNQA